MSKEVEFLTAGQVAAPLKLKAKTVLNHWRRLGLPAPVRLGRGQRSPKRWLKDEFDAYLAGLIRERDRLQKVVDLEQRRPRRAAG